jgi:hypothetical protein
MWELITKNAGENVAAKVKCAMAELNLYPNVEEHRRSDSANAFRSWTEGTFGA